MKEPLDKLLTCLELIALAAFITLWVKGYLHEYGCWWP